MATATPHGAHNIRLAMLQAMRRLFRRQTDKIAGPYVSDLGTHLSDQDTRLVEQEARLGELLEGNRLLRQELGETREKLESMADLVDAELSRAGKMLRLIHDEDSAQRRRLYALRAGEEYELAFTEPEPLVSFLVPTYQRFESLRDTCLPSILNQTYSNVEVIVAGDCAPPETARVIAELGDPRVRFHNRTVRGPYPEDRSVRWYMIGTPPYNDALSLARGRWIAALGDDDAVRPEHTETLLAAARERRLEHCYGRHAVHYPDGETLEVGSFPPVKGEYVLQTALYHAGLAFFQMEPADHLYAEPNDWSLCQRMLEAGVSFGMVEEILADKYESRYESHSDWGVHGIPSVD
jgi:hypothetical protein